MRGLILVELLGHVAEWLRRGLSPTMSTIPVAAISLRSGCSARHETHQEAQILSSHTFPCISLTEVRASVSSSRGSLNVGAGLPTSGEGTSRGSSLSPIARKIPTITNMTSGSPKRQVLTTLVGSQLRSQYPYPVENLGMTKVSAAFCRIADMTQAIEHKGSR